jgi:hypothetical protein
MRSGGASARPEMVAIRVTPERKSQSFESQQYADHCDHHFAPRGAHERDTAGDVPAYSRKLNFGFNYSNSASCSDSAEFELLNQVGSFDGPAVSS